MTDRVIVTADEVPFETDILNSNLFAMTGIAKLAEAVLGTSTQITGLACTPTASPSMTVDIAPGQIYELADVDQTIYGVIPPDATQILKQGLTPEDPQNFPVPAPVTVGTSIIYLVQIAFEEEDTNLTARPFFNSADPQAPIFNTIYGTRSDQCIVQVKAGSPAMSPVAPTPDVGFVGAWLIEVAYGQTSIISSNITLYPGAPFINGTLGDFLTEAEANALYAPLSGSIISGMMFDWAGPTAPSGYLLCDGTSYLTATYPSLFAAIAYAWGGSGANFNVPDLRSRIALGAGAGPGLTARTLAQNGGDETATLLIANLAPHDHPGSTADPHTHIQNNSGVGFNISNTGGPHTVLEVFPETEPTTVADVDTLTIASQGSGTPFSIMNPFAVVTKIIKI